MTNLFLNRFEQFSWGRRFRRLFTIFFIGMLLFSFFDAGEEEAFVIAFMSILMMHVMIKFVFAFDATRSISDDKRSSALELLLITPSGEHSIVEGQAAAFRMQFRSSVRLLFMFTLALQFTTVVNDNLNLRGDDLLFLSSFIWGPMIWTWSDYRSIAWVGMHHSLKQGTHLKAMMRTLAGIMLIPWMPYFFVLLMMAEANADEGFAGFVTFVWAFGAAIYQKVRTVSRRERLLRDFGYLATGAPTSRTEHHDRSDSYAIFPKGSGAARVMDWVSALGSNSSGQR